MTVGWTNYFWKRRELVTLMACEWTYIYFKVKGNTFCPHSVVSVGIHIQLHSWSDPKNTGFECSQVLLIRGNPSGRGCRWRHNAGAPSIEWMHIHSLVLPQLPSISFFDLFAFSICKIHFLLYVYFPYLFHLLPGNGARVNNVSSCCHKSSLYFSMKVQSGASLSSIVKSRFMGNNQNVNGVIFL